GLSREPALSFIGATTTRSRHSQSVRREGAPPWWRSRTEPRVCQLWRTWSLKSCPESGHHWRGSTTSDTTASAAGSSKRSSRKRATRCGGSWTAPISRPTTFDGWLRDWTRMVGSKKLRAYAFAQRQIDTDDHRLTPERALLGTFRTPRNVRVTSASRPEQDITARRNAARSS